MSRKKNETEKSRELLNFQKSQQQMIPKFWNPYYSYHKLEYYDNISVGIIVSVLGGYRFIIKNKEGQEFTAVLPRFLHHQKYHGLYPGKLVYFAQEINFGGSEYLSYNVTSYIAGLVLQENYNNILDFREIREEMNATNRSLSTTLVEFCKTKQAFTDDSVKIHVINDIISQRMNSYLHKHPALKAKVSQAIQKKEDKKKTLVMTPNNRKAGIILFISLFEASSEVFSLLPDDLQYLAPYPFYWGLFSQNTLGFLYAKLFQISIIALLQRNPMRNFSSSNPEDEYSPIFRKFVSLLSTFEISASILSYFSWVDILIYLVRFLPQPLDYCYPNKVRIGDYTMKFMYHSVFRTCNQFKELSDKHGNDEDADEIENDDEINEDIEEEIEGPGVEESWYEYDHDLRDERLRKSEKKKKGKTELMKTPESFILFTRIAPLMLDMPINLDEKSK